MDGIQGATAFAESFCQRQGVAAEDALRLGLIIEELFTNTVTHGHGGDSDAVISLGLSLTGQEATLILVYEDQAPPFDPVQHLSQTPAALETPVDQRPVGGLGVHLVAQLAHSMAYSRSGNVNRLIVQLRCRP